MAFDGWNDELYHHGIKGQKWGIRRYQNADGSLTAEGRSRYGYGDNLTKDGQRAYRHEYKKLKKLEGRADVEKQRQNIEKYNKRAKIAGAVSLASAALAGAGHFGGNALNTKYRNQYAQKYLQAVYRYDDDKLIADLNSFKSSKKAVTNNINTATKVAAGVAAVSAGFFAYNKIQAHLSKTRITEAGHAKAVAKVKAQVDKMQKMFGDVKLSDIIKKKSH